MKYEIEVIDAEPTKMERLDNGEIEGFKLRRSINNQEYDNKSIGLIATALSRMLLICFYDIEVSQELRNTSRDGNFCPLINLCITDNDDSVNINQNVIWTIIITFFQEVITNFESASLTLFSEGKYNVDDVLSQFIKKLANDFIVYNSSKKIVRPINIRFKNAPKECRAQLSGSCKKQDVGQRVDREHRDITAKITGFDENNESLTLLCTKTERKYKAKIDLGCLYSLLPELKPFYRFKVTDGFLLERNNSELRITNITEIEHDEIEVDESIQPELKQNEE